MERNGVSNGVIANNGMTVTNGTAPAKVKAANNAAGNGKSVDKFVMEALDLIVMEGLHKGKDKNTPVINFKTPDELLDLIDFKVGEKPVSHDRLLELCKDVFRYSVKTGHPHFFNQLFAGLDPYSFVGQVLTDVLNPSIYTYEVAPVFIMMEKELLKMFCDYVGYKEGDGTFSPGGSYSNMLGMNLARFRKFPEVKEKGLRQLPRMVAFTSAHSHYSNKKNASLMGLGTDDLIRVKVDNQGRMDVEDLERCILKATGEGAVPFVVIATSGTTVLGAFDPLNRIADLCEKYNLWLHVDGAWGASTLLSPLHRHLCDGIHRSDSVTWNPHKMMMAPLQCCVFITKHMTIMKECHSFHVPYLFQQDKTLYHPDYDVGTKVIQCGRKVDALKLWLMWKAHGRNGLMLRIEKAYDHAQYLTELIKNREGFKLVQEPQWTNVCFWYVPQRLRAREWNLNDMDFCREMAAIPPAIKERMTQSGSMLVGYQPVGDWPNFFRMIVINDELDYKDMEFVVNEIDSLGRDL